MNLLPGTTTLFVSGIAWTLFDGANNFLITWVIVVIGTYISSVVLYLIGRYGGRKLLFWLFSREEIERRLDWFGRNGAKGVPWLFLIPLFPTDLMCITCGAAKMKFRQYLLIVLVFRPIEMLLLLLYPMIIGSDIVRDMEVWQRILVVNVIIINFFLLAIYHKKIVDMFNKTFSRKYKEDELMRLLLEKEKILEEQKKAEQNES